MKIKKLLSVLLVLCLMLAMLPAVKMQVNAVAYSATAAIAYANTHWNDGKGLCAEFVSDCLAEGGITIPNVASYYSYSTQSYNNNSGTLGWYTNPYTCAPALLLYLSEYYTVITNPSSSQIDVGDVVFMLGGSNGDSRDAHVGIIISTDSGVPVYAAHNRATNTGKFSNSYPCTYVVKMGGLLTAPEKPIITTTTPYYAEGSDITISWNAVAGNIYYWINVYKDGDLIVDQSMGNATTYTLKTAAKGEYEFAVSANNSAGTSGGSQYFCLVGAKPENPTIATTTPYYAEGSDITISWNAVAGNTYYWINVYKDGDLIVDQSMGNATTYTLKAAAKGEYEFAVSANNSAGTSGGSQYFCLVGVKPKIPEISNDILYYNVGESAAIKWNAVIGNVFYWINVYKDGVLIVDQSMENQTIYTISSMSKGAYTVFVSANNSAGTSGSDTYQFTVGELEYVISYDANGGTRAPEYQIKTHGEYLNLSTSEPTRLGYVFLGWATSSEATNPEYQPGDTFTIDADTTLYAVWEEENNEPSPVAPQLVVEKVTAVAGDTVTVTLAISNSPGFGGMAYDVYYDTTLLELISFELGLGSAICTDSGIDTYPGRVNFQYASTENVSGDGTLVTFTFKVKEDAQTGFSPITVFPEEGTSFYYDGRKEIDFNLFAVDGGIEIIDYMKGNINGDGKVNNRDAARLMQYLAGWDVDYVAAALDVNGDGKINNRDAVRLMQYLAGWEVEIH